MSGQSPLHFDWGVPGVTIPLPLSKNPIPAAVTPWNDLQFTPVGAYEVQPHIGIPMDEYSCFNCSHHKFLASDLAWLASGTSEDGNHLVSPDEFFPEFMDLYNSQPTGTPGQTARKAWAERIRQLMFDLMRNMSAAAPQPTRSRAPMTPTHPAPPAYATVSPSHFASSSPASALSQSAAASPWHGDLSSPQGGSSADAATPITDEFLETHGLMGIANSIALIIRVVSAVKWLDELGRLVEQLYLVGCARRRQEAISWLDLSAD
ncbi:hypothetical protein B0H10DRAFT_2223061 [Mycena sp. CBHHK59/15]|nr:hypothetical protein B0H10DRAFT_2223061 [Mycena sp. CBHHK59/15]